MTDVPLPLLAMEIVTAYAARRHLAIDDVGRLLESVATTLDALAAPPAAAPVPAVPIRHSITRDCIVCLEDGRKGKLLKGYLRRVFNMTPDQYRAKWGLPRDYPMVAPDYAVRRSRLARLNGLGGARRHAARAVANQTISQPTLVTV